MKISGNQRGALLENQKTSRTVPKTLKPPFILNEYQNMKWGIDQIE